MLKLYASLFLSEVPFNKMIEGGNWRIKYELRTSYFVEGSITARTVLICLYDSIYTFRNGMSDESFAHKHTNWLTSICIITVRYK
ncbi:hypothetical protein HYW99_00520 [Candidatus Woesearchaeota archaeon]|nr:hypothetical protein [Candidatus Woesearchaeota archaeon]